MQTWLDAFAIQCATKLTEKWAVRMNDPADPTHRHMPAPLKAEVARITRAFKAGGPVLEAAQAYALGFGQLYRESGYPLSDYSRVSVTITAGLLNMAIPFLFGFPDDVSGYDAAAKAVHLKRPVAGVGIIGSIVPAAMAPIAVKVDRDLIDDLFDTRAPVSDEIDAEIRAHAWCFDIPAGAIRMSAQHEVRTILLCPDTNGAVAAYAVYCRPGTNAWSHVNCWPLLVTPGMAVPRGISPPEHLPDFDSDIAVEQLTDLIRLLVAYRTVAKGAEEEAVPRLPGAKLASDRNWKAKIKKFSLFRMNTLRAPADRFGRGPRTTHPEGWRLGWRVSVKGHFRWQPHGQGRSLRKLIWIEAFERGPADAPHKRDLERLSVAALPDGTS